MKFKTKIILFLFLSAIAISRHSDAANWMMVKQGEEFGTGESAITEFVDIDSIQKTDKTTKKAWIRLFYEGGQEEEFLVLFTKSGMMRMVDSNPPHLITNEEWQIIEEDSYWEKAYFEIWTEKEREVSKKKKPNNWKDKGKAAAKKAADRVLDQIGL